MLLPTPGVSFSSAIRLIAGAWAQTGDSAHFPCVDAVLSVGYFLHPVTSDQLTHLNLVSFSVDTDVCVTPVVLSGLTGIKKTVLSNIKNTCRDCCIYSSSVHRRAMTVGRSWLR